MDRSGGNHAAQPNLRPLYMKDPQPLKPSYPYSLTTEKTPPNTNLSSDVDPPEHIQPVQAQVFEHICETEVARDLCSIKSSK